MDDTQETLSNLREAGFPASEILVVDGVVYVGGDAAVSLQASREMLAVGGDSQEQYRTTNLVSAANSTIVIRAAPSTPLTILTGLVEAVANYKDLPITLDPFPDPCMHAPDCPPTTPFVVIDLVINPVLPGGASATSSFPSGGKPGSRIALGPGVAQLPANTIKHLITHEIGHAIGLRHSDFFNRAISCGGTATNEGTAGVGAIHIAGTPTGASAGGSLMNTCIPTGTAGEFSASDITALETLY
ncbi:M57 family metalloprotease [Pyxidicoccus trucidator]|uniref:M57 family metalloprotease n=1 Tax=Pyxidicoccus trucidator TaxID=2709662 RepID=UPI0013DA79CF|nr:M57 family metalloprotease [Pyxidicoccus trucidator]